MLSRLFKRFFPSAASPMLPPAASAASSPSSFDVNALLSKIEAKDPSVLHLYRVGDGFLWMNEGNAIEGVKTERITTLLGAEHIKPIFPHRILIANAWDKNAVYYNLGKSRFPNLNTIVLLSHPCEYSVPWRYKNATWICPHGYDKYFDHHPGYVQLSEAETNRLYKAVEAMPCYSAKRGPGDHNWMLQGVGL